ncbi:CHAT domain-containing protein [Desulfonema magnum]|uniref:Tetratricopeptide repeat-containing protein n=1 Tax=Desulfonema magnum TaxID=45655 RepID=A0A975BM38_9BACT|nr:CHAT domain-containing protein [Desulfonema magnum]QTA87980.1 Tetratricopeptide repeat-containing protein [Desulfonema magnum]
MNANDLEMNKGYVSSGSLDTGGNTDPGGNISIVAGESVNISGSGADDLGLFGDYYGVYSQTMSERDGGKITIKTDDLTLTKDAMINAQTYGGGRGGNVELDINRLEVHEGGTITTSTRGAGDSGDISIFAGESVNISGSGVKLDKSWIYTATHSSGSGGDLTISTPHMTIGENGHIYANTLGDETWDGNTLQDGRAGDIIIQDMERLELSHGGTISAASESTGQGGNIRLINVNALDMTNEASISAKSTRSGHAGDIFIISADSMRIDQSSVTTESDVSGGGRMTINVKNAIHLSDGRITTTVQGGSDDAGDISIDPEFVTLNQSEIIAKAYEGNGGNIRIVADHFIQSAGSEVDASSELGIDGLVEIKSPEEDASKGLAALPENYLDATRWVKTPCAKRTGESELRFVLTKRDSLPTPLDDWLASPPLAFGDSDAADFYHKGDFEHAAEIWEKEREKPDFFKKPASCADTLVCLTTAYQAMGYYQKALSVLEEALPVIEKNNDAYAKALLFGTLGDIYLSCGDAEKAKAYLEKGQKAVHSEENPLLETSLLNNMGNVFAVNEAYDKAKEAYMQGADLVEGTPLKSKILINLLRVRSWIGGDGNILTQAENIISQIESLPNSHHKAADMISLAFIVQRIGKELPSESRLEEIPHELLHKARQIAEALEDTRIAAYAYGYIGELYEAENRFSDALNMTRKAVFYAQQTDSPEILYRWQWQLGRLFRSQGDIENAVSAFNNAVSTLNPIRSEFFTGYRSQIKNTFGEQIRPVYLGLAELLLKQTKTSESVLCSEGEASPLCKARDTMELLKTAELEDFFQDECVTALRKKSIRLDKASSHTAVIYPILLPDHLAMLLILGDGMKQITVPANPEELRNTAMQFRDELQSLRSYEFRNSAQYLYDQLIRPIETELSDENIDTLIVAPDGSLRSIPFSALCDGKHYLIEKYAIVTIPGTTLVDPKPIDKENAEVLLSGLSEARQNFKPLENVPEELSDIKTVMGGKILQDEAYTVDNIDYEFKNHEYSIVHIATHGEFGGTAKNSFLLTYDGKLTMDKLEHVVGIGRFRENPLELLTLSACQTASGNERAVLGLAGVAIKAGARSAIATLWSVNDKTTSLAMREFYRRLGESDISKAKALQNAQKELISQGYHHPYYWAPFLLIGNWL